MQRAPCSQGKLSNHPLGPVCLPLWYSWKERVLYCGWNEQDILTHDEMSAGGSLYWSSVLVFHQTAVCYSMINFILDYLRWILVLNVKKTNIIFSALMPSPCSLAVLELSVVFQWSKVWLLWAKWNNYIQKKREEVCWQECCC